MLLIQITLPHTGWPGEQKPLKLLSSRIFPRERYGELLPVHVSCPQERHLKFLPWHEAAFAAKQHLPCLPRAAAVGPELAAAGGALGWARTERAEQPQPAQARELPASRPHRPASPGTASSHRLPAWPTSGQVRCPQMLSTLFSCTQRALSFLFFTALTLLGFCPQKVRLQSFEASQCL